LKCYIGSTAFYGADNWILRKLDKKCYIGSTAFYGADNWILRKLDKKFLPSF